MRMENRHRVEGTIPAVHIGHRVFRDRHGVLKVSNVWHAEYWVDGRQRAKSLKTTNKAAALRAAFALSEQIGQGSVPQQRKKSITVEALTQAYMVMQDSQDRATKTMEKYRCILKAFNEWVATQSIGSAFAFREEHFWAYRKQMVENGKSPKTISGHLILIKQVFKWGAGRGQLLNENHLALAQVKEPEPTPQPCFTPEQVNALLEAADEHYAPIFAFLAYAGLRFGEVRALRWQDILLDRGKQGILFIRLGGSGSSTKSGRSRQIPIHPRLRGVIDELPREGERVFRTKPSVRWPNGTPLNERTVIGELKRLCEVLAFDNPRQYKIHTFRHAFASMCARNNTSYKYALQFMGHQSSEILDLYYTMFDDTAADAIATIDYGPDTSAA